jgi:hypothetical protein
MSSIESVVTESRVFPPADAVVKKATISGMAAYEALCKEAEQDYAGYWAAGQGARDLEAALHPVAGRVQCTLSTNGLPTAS